MTHCNHKFLRIGEVSRMPEGQNSVRFIPGVSTGCPHCGQIRYLYIDGVLEIKVEGAGSPIYDDESSR